MIIIIGAGISGLAAARKLHDANKDVMILEARDRIGGRIHTDRQFDFPFDMGASWAHDLAVNAVAKNSDLGLKLLPFGDFLSQVNDHAVYDENNNRISDEFADKIKSFSHTFLSHLVTQAADCNVANVLDKFQHPVLNDNETRQVKCWLKNLLSCWAGAELTKTDLSLWKIMLEEEGNAYVENGYDTVLNHLAININIQLNMPVRKIDYSQKTVKIYTDENVFEADFVIVTLPIGVLQKGQCQFVPELPARKTKAINSIGSGLLNKALLRFPHCFWDEHELSIQRFATEDTPIQVYINYQAIMDVPCLVAMYGADTAEKIEEMTTQQYSDIFLNPLREIYCKKFIEPTNIVPTSWNNDPYALGAYSYLPRGNDENSFKILGEAVDNRLFFAGEAAIERDYACVHGAYSSGLRAADQVKG